MATTKKTVVSEKNAPIKSLAGKTVGGVQFNQNGYAVPKNPTIITPVAAAPKPVTPTINWNDVGNKIVQDEIYKKAAAGQKLDITTAPKQALYDSYVAQINSDKAKKAAEEAAKAAADKATAAKKAAEEAAKAAADKAAAEKAALEAKSAEDAAAAKAALDAANAKIASLNTNTAVVAASNEVASAKANADGYTPTTASADYAKSAYDTADTDARSYAELVAGRKIQEQKDAISNLMSRLASQRDSSIKMAEADAEAKRQGLEASAFKANRQAQQAMAGRGLVGTGIAADVAARQGMANQAELSAMYGDLNTKKFDIQEQYRLADEEQAQALKTLEANKTAMTEEEYQNALNNIYSRTSSKLSTIQQGTSLDTQQNQWQQNFNYQKVRDAVSDSQWTQQFEYAKASDAQKMAYTQLRDSIGDKQWQASFDENARQFGLNYAINEAQVTGKFNGQDTLASKQFNSQEKQQNLQNLWTAANATGTISKELSALTGIKEGTKTLDAINAEASRNIAMAQVTGKITDPVTGKSVDTMEAKQKALENLWKVADATGTIGGELSRITGIPSGTQTLEARKMANDYAIASAKANGSNSMTMTSSDILSAVMDVKTNIANAYNSIADTDKKGNKLDPKQVKAARDAEAQKVFFTEVDKLVVDPRLTTAQKLDIAKKWASGENGVGAKSWAKAQDLISGKSAPASTKTTASNSAKKGAVTLSTAVKAGNKEAIKDQATVKELESWVSKANAEYLADKKANLIQQGYKGDALKKALAGLKRPKSIKDEQLANLKKKTY